MKYTLLYQPNLTLAEVLKTMEENGEGFLAILKEENYLMGIVHEADILNAIFTNRHSIEDIIDKTPTVYLADSPQTHSSQNKSNRPQKYIPIVNKKNQLVGFFEAEKEKIVKKPNKVVIMAGGLGTRLGELTHSIPKPMLPMGHKPILHIILNSLIDYGFSDFYFCVNYKAEVIREYFGDGSAFGANIEYIEESHSLGTAGALSLIKEDFEHPFILMNGDLVTTLNFNSLLNFHLERDSQATMCVHEYNQRLPYGVVHTRNGKILNLEEKPYHTYFVNAGIYVLNPHLKKDIPFNQPFDITALFEKLIADENIDPHAYIINEFWVDIGQVNEYEKTRRVFTDLGI